MRLLLCLITALITTLNAKNALRHVTEYRIPNGLPNGAILTFYFWHEGDSSEFESVDINFYDLPSVDIDEVYDITAHLRFDRNSDKPVVSNTYLNGRWQSQTIKEQPLDGNPAANGWWRVDVIKLDNEQLNVFFQGFWSDVRSFQKSLDNVQSIYISKHVDHNRTQILLKVPNGNIAPLSFDQFKTDLYSRHEKTLISFPKFPAGSHMEMTAVLAASGGERDRKPSLVFKPTDGTEHFMKIFQIWEGDTESLYISIRSNDKGILCTNEKPNGDLQHLRFKRISQEKISLQVFYKPSTGVSGVTCEHTLPGNIASEFDKPFNITSLDGALLFHLEHSVARTLENTTN